jgi:hypothetical protein
LATAAPLHRWAIRTRKDTCHEKDTTRCSVNSAAAPAIADEAYHRSTGLEQAKAYCEVFANGAQPNDAGLIAAYMIHARNYDSCMVLKGYARNSDKPKRALPTWRGCVGP